MILRKNSSWIMVTVFLFFSFFVGTAGAAVYLSPDGDDSKTGTQAFPWKTFSYAFEQMSGGDELILLDGTYSIAEGTGCINFDGTNSGQPPSGASRDNMTIVRALNQGSVIVDGAGDYGGKGLFIGRSTRKDSYIKIAGITFHGGGSLYNSSYVYVKNCGFKGHFGIGTNDHNNGNTYNLVEDVWIWTENSRIAAANYRSDNNVWRRVVVRADGGTEPAWSGGGSPEVGFTVYTAKNVSVQNMIVVDRLLVTHPTLRYPYGDFASAQHASGSSSFETPLENNEWLGCMSVNSEDSGFHLEADESLSPTYHLDNCISVGLIEGFPGFNLGDGKDSIIENCTVVRESGAGSFYRHSPSSSEGQITRNVIGTGPADRGIISGGDTSYVDLFGTYSIEKYYDTSVSTEDLTSDPQNDGTPASLIYPVRIEDGSLLSGAGYNGRDIGANIILKTGVDGTFYGDTGYNITTAEPLWPWPNEDRIKNEMSEDYGYSNEKRGFCSDGKQLNGVDDITLTSYIWEYLGNEMPSDISAGSGSEGDSSGSGDDGDSSGGSTDSGSDSGSCFISAMF